MRKLIEIINDSGEFTARTYSGRFMYGRQCVGVTCENVFRALAAITEGVAAEDDADLMTAWVEILAGTKSDSMGRDEIIYWPRMEWPDDLPRQEEEDDSDECGSEGGAV